MIMGKIYSAPDNIKLPVFNVNDIGGSKLDEERYICEVIEYCRSYNPIKSQTDSYIGEMVSIPQGDGKACYIVLSTKPVELIHLQIGDAWDSSYADLLTAKRIKEMIDGDKKLKELFSKK